MNSLNNTKRFKSFIVDSLERTSRYNYVLLLILPTLYVLAFFIIPLIWTIRVSFYPGGAFEYTPGFTFSHYLRFFSSSYYMGILLYTIKLTLVVVPFVLLFSYSIAYLIATASKKMAAFYLALIAIPMFTTVVIRVLGWQIMLSEHGIINTLLLNFGIVSKPLRLLYCDAAIEVALIQSVTPYATLILIGVIVGIKKLYIDAARVFGANRLKAFLHVTLPLSMPGISGVVVVAFMWCMSSYAVPAFLGSGAQRTVTMVVVNQILSVFNWPFGDAVAGILVLITLFSLVIYIKFSESKELE